MIPMTTSDPRVASGSPPARHAGTVSVVIPCYRRRARLLRVLELLGQQRIAPLEVIVVDASPVDERLSTDEIDGFRPWLRYFTVKVEGNISRQRNTAVRRCRGEYILFLDDDVEFGPDLIARYQEVFEATQADGISGIVLQPGEQMSANPRRRRLGMIYDPGAPDCHTFDGQTETHVICTANFAVRGKALRTVGGFDEQVHGTLDDVDLGVRLAYAGFHIIHHNGPSVLHWKDQGDGSRAPELGDSWGLANLFYFQGRHFWRRGRLVLLGVTLWQFCRPSRHWLTPRVVVNRWRTILRSYAEACRRLRQGPITPLERVDSWDRMTSLDADFSAKSG